MGEGRGLVRNEAPGEGSGKRGAPADKSVGKAERQTLTAMLRSAALIV